MTYLNRKILLKVMDNLFYLSFAVASISFTITETKLFKPFQEWLKEKNVFIGELFSWNRGRDGGRTLEYKLICDFLYDMKFLCHAKHA